MMVSHRAVGIPSWTVMVDMQSSQSTIKLQGDLLVPHILYNGDNHVPILLIYSFLISLFEVYSCTETRP